MEPELVIFYDKARHPEAELDYQPSHRTLDRQSVLFERCAEVMVSQKL